MLFLEVRLFFSNEAAVGWSSLPEGSGTEVTVFLQKVFLLGKVYLAITVFSCFISIFPLNNKYLLFYPFCALINTRCKCVIYSNDNFV